MQSCTQASDVKSSYTMGAVAATVLALSLVLVSCGGSTEEATTSSQSPETTTGKPAETTAPTVAEMSQVEAAVAEGASGEAASEEAASGDSAGVVEHLRQKTMQFWEAYNAYDVDTLMVFYEESYWAEQEDEVRSNMRPFELNRMTITATESSPPAELAPGRWETRHDARFSGGSLEMVFIFEQFDGEWLLTHAEVR